jgi:hypothetical protein
MKKQSTAKRKSSNFEIKSLSESEMNQKILDLMQEPDLAFSYDPQYSSETPIPDMNKKTKK